MRCPSYAPCGLAALLALAIPVAAAQTVLPVAPQVEALDRCHKLVGTHGVEAESAAREVLAASGTTPDQRLSATICMAVAQALSGRRDESAESLEHAWTLLDAPGVTPRGRLDGRKRLPFLLVRLGRVEEALALQEEVLVEAREQGIVPVQIESLRFMAQVRATEFDDPEGALPYFRQAYDLHHAMVGASGSVNPPLSYDLGYTLMLLGRYDEADVLFSEADKAAAPIPELAGMRDRIASHRAEIQRLRGHAAAAEPRLVAVLARQRAGGDLAGEATTLYRLARARLDLGRPREAMGVAREALDAAERGRYPAEERDALDVLADIHAALGQHELALEYAKRELESDRTLDREGTERRLASMQARAADREMTSGAVVDRIGVARGALLRNVVNVVLSVLALVALLLLLRARRRQRQLERVSVTDPLTRLPDRRGATRRIEELENEGAGRAALLLVGVDRLSAINDRYGRDAGDQLLIAVARRLRESCDPSDIVARWDGKEFMVLREETSQEAAFALAAHLMAQVDGLQVDDGAGSRLTPTVSIGVVSLPLFPGGIGGRQDVLRAADRALYAAKRIARSSWVGIWGAADGVDAAHALDDMAAALANGWLVIDGHPAVDPSAAWEIHAEQENAPVDA